METRNPKKGEGVPKETPARNNITALARILAQHFPDRPWKRLKSELEKRNFFAAGMQEQVRLMAQVAVELSESQRHGGALITALAQSPVEKIRGVAAFVVPILYQDDLPKQLEWLHFTGAVEGTWPRELSAIILHNLVIQHGVSTVLPFVREWIKDANPAVRRLVTEAFRSRGVMLAHINELKKDPSPLKEILERLLDDPSDYVQKSVANNLNDISKDNPDLVMQIVNRWQGSSRETDWIIKHGCRTLLRKAHDHTLSVFGFSSAVLCEIANLSVEPPQIRIGDALHFSFQLISKEKQPVKYRVEYAVDFVKSNGKHSRKLFKITENTFQPNTPYPFKRTQRFHDLTTRKHYPGKHQLGILINGNELAKLPFTLLEQE